MDHAARKTATLHRLALAASLLGGLAGCEVDRPRPPLRSVLAAQTGTPCDCRCGARCPPCGSYQPTVWQSWNCGPMAVRCGAGESSNDSVPDWLKNLPKPGPGGTDRSQPELVPAPPAKAGDASNPDLGSGFKMRPQAAPAPALNPGEGKDSGLDEGFQLRPHGPASGDKPALKGLDTPPGTTMPDVDRNSEGSPPALPGQVPPAIPKEAAPSDKKPASPPGLAPVAPPVIN